VAILSELTPRGAVLALLAVLIGLLAVGLAVAPANRQANRLLAAALLVLAGVSAAYTIEVSRLDRAAGWLRHLPLSVPLALGPLLYGCTWRLGCCRRSTWPRRIWC
jgi:drug/metabolite transporter (DMT)-like permease